MKSISAAIALGVILQASTAAANAQALDTDIMDDLTSAQQEKVRQGYQVMVTNPLTPTPNHWTVTYYQKVGSSLPNADTFGSAAVYADYESQPDYQFPFLLDFQIQAGAGTAAVKGLVATPGAEGQPPALNHQVNAVFRSGDPANPLYSATYHGTDLPTPTALFLSTFGAVDFQRDAVTGSTVMRYNANIIPSAAVAGNESLKNLLLGSGASTVQKHADRMKSGATPRQLHALHKMLNDND
jgi:hypothetical protein